MIKIQYHTVGSPSRSVEYVLHADSFKAQFYLPSATEKQNRAV